MSDKTKKIMSWAFGGGVLLMLGLLYLLNPIDKAAANPSTISLAGQNRFSTASATGTPAFMTPGTATTTLTFDTINKISTTTLALTVEGEQNATAVDNSFLALQMTGSSSLTSTLRVDFEYSNDGIDFYKDFLLGYSTTTLVRYSSSTPLGIGGQSQGDIPNYRQTSAKTFGILIKVPDVPARYIRAVLSVPIGAGNSTNWAQFITKQQR